MPHFYSLKDSFELKEEFQSFENIYLINPRNSQETDENLIEKHALLDVLLNT